MSNPTCSRSRSWRSELSPEELSVAFDHVGGLGGLVDTTLVGQVDQEIATLQRVTGPHAR